MFMQICQKIMSISQPAFNLEIILKWEILIALLMYSVIHIYIHPSKDLCSKMAPGEVDVSLP